MHALLTFSLFIFAFWKGDWRHWQKYIHTIFYVITCNLLYAVLCRDHLLWKYRPDFLPKSHFMVELFYSFINLPSITLIFLSHFPFSKPLPKQAGYLLTWIIGALLVEYPFVKWGRLLLIHGYEYWMEPMFYLAMFGMIRLHYSRPFLTYGISIVIIVFMVNYFHVPIK
ncbi:CBO0543 family protein [Neobacillus sp. NRS-1170]|uniref:CBO0543 family protein n=1 Tax=Neobacillus sp. NRS-1170 TaxID=3233898 RepID=UPI003D2E8835